MGFWSVLGIWLSGIGGGGGVMGSWSVLGIWLPEIWLSGLGSGGVMGFWSIWDLAVKYRSGGVMVCNQEHSSF